MRSVDSVSRRCSATAFAESGSCIMRIRNRDGIPGAPSPALKQACLLCFLGKCWTVFGRIGTEVLEGQAAAFVKLQFRCVRMFGHHGAFSAVERSVLCRSRREVSDEYLLAKFGFNTAENEPCKVCRKPMSCPRFGSVCSNVRSAPPASAELRIFSTRCSSSSKKDLRCTAVLIALRCHAAEVRSTRA